MTALEVLPSSTLAVTEPYVAYSYSYPHKSAYGPLYPPVPLAPVWQAERRDALFLYVHLPFCEMRCGFCNLFTRAQPAAESVTAYLATLGRQVRVVAALLGDFTIARLALGGGTPTFLTAEQLEWLLSTVAKQLHCTPKQIPTSVETSPKTALPDRLAVLRNHGVQRVSIGIQSFDDAETHALGRPQSAAEIHIALERLRDFPLLNLDLIYGHPVQTLASWRRSVRQALQYEPEEIFLYPLYMRPGTGLGRQGRVQRAASAHTRELYRAGREILLEAGYEQFSMRCFQKPKPFREAGPQYCCQTDGMVGLGCGARSYTTHLHYANRFAVETAAVQTILEEWIAQPDAAFQKAYWGIPLSHEDRQRRFVIQSLLNSSGLDSTAFTQLFGLSVAELFPQLPQWAEAGFAECTAGHWRLTTLGMEWSDALGPALYSAASRAALEAFAHP